MKYEITFECLETLEVKTTTAQGLSNNGALINAAKSIGKPRRLSWLAVRESQCYLHRGSPIGHELIGFKDGDLDYICIGIKLVTV